MAPVARRTGRRAQIAIDQRLVMNAVLILRELVDRDLIWPHVFGVGVAL